MLLSKGPFGPVYILGMVSALLLINAVPLFAGVPPNKTFFYQNNLNGVVELRLGSLADADFRTRLQ